MQNESQPIREEKSSLETGNPEKKDQKSTLIQYPNTKIEDLTEHPDTPKAFGIIGM